VVRIGTRVGIIRRTEDLERVLTGVGTDGLFVAEDSVDHNRSKQHTYLLFAGTLFPAEIMKARNLSEWGSTCMKKRDQH
jgi:hypothetical protein